MAPVEPLLAAPTLGPVGREGSRTKWRNIAQPAKRKRTPAPRGTGGGDIRKWLTRGPGRDQTQAPIVNQGRTGQEERESQGQTHRQTMDTGEGLTLQDRKGKVDSHQ